MHRGFLCLQFGDGLHHMCCRAICQPPRVFVLSELPCGLLRFIRGLLLSYVATSHFLDHDPILHLLSRFSWLHKHEDLRRPCFFLIGTGAVSSGSCQMCHQGYSSPAASSTCNQCSSGTFSSANGSAQCTTCNWGTYSDAGASMCKACSAGTVSLAGQPCLSFAVYLAPPAALVVLIAGYCLWCYCRRKREHQPKSSVQDPTSPGDVQIACTRDPRKGAQILQLRCN
mmetsp:Transcript_89297/g.238770  ORF Transcript_89297/g.238770 Transcript_89297/m.238770 type:complete len:227 (+) Transcript_89297:469-1149(+)